MFVFLAYLRRVFGKRRTAWFPSLRFSQQKAQAVFLLPLFHLSLQLLEQLVGQIMAFLKTLFELGLTLKLVRI